MYIVEIIFNTDANNKRIDDPALYPSCFYGPFRKKYRAEYFEQHVFEDDKDVHDTRIIELNQPLDFLKF